VREEREREREKRIRKTSNQTIIVQTESLSLAKHRRQTMESKEYSLIEYSMISIFNLQSQKGKNK